MSTTSIASKLAPIAAWLVAILLLTGARQLSPVYVILLGLPLVVIHLTERLCWQKLGLMVLIGLSWSSAVYFWQWLPLHFAISTLVLVCLLALMWHPSKMSGWSAMEVFLTRFYASLPTAFLVILGLCNLVGMVQFVIVQTDIQVQHDDAFIGFYSRSGIAMHGLGIINTWVGTICLLRYLTSSTIKHLLLAIFFGISAVLCYYGLGFLCWTVVLVGITLLLFHHPFAQIALVDYLALMLILLLAILPRTGNYTVSTLHSSQQQYDYEPRIVDSETLQSQTNSGPLRGIARANQLLKEKNAKFDFGYGRKGIMVQSWYHYYAKDWDLLLFGSGPGTFCSRTAFMLSGHYSSNATINRLAPQEQPYLAKALSLPLWSPQVLKTPFADGTKNQPFSSFFACMAEYGLLFTLFLLAIAGVHFTSICLQTESYFQRLALMAILANGLLHLLTDNFAEGSEFLVWLLAIGWLVRTPWHAHTSSS